jgi:Na+:H+ antiporter, NhaA family
LRFVFRNFPLANAHPHAEHAAEAAEAAAAQGEDWFWALHDRLYAHQRALADADLRGHAAAVGLDLERFDREMAEGRYRARVREDFLSGCAAG